MNESLATSRRIGAEGVAATRLDEVRAAASAARDAGRPLTLATLLVGDDAGSAMYVTMKQDEARALGIDSRDIRLPADVGQTRLEEVLHDLSNARDVDAILVQYPLPSPLDYGAALRVIDPRKDVDGLHPMNLGSLLIGDPAVVPCTPRGILDLLEWHGIAVAGRRATLVGRGLTVGRPLAALLSQRAPNANATVTVIHTGSRPEDLRTAIESAEIVVGAAGSPGLIKPDWLSPGCVLVAAGVSFPNGKAVSDFAKGCRERAGAWTPTVGGVGPMTRAWLFLNVVRCRELQAG